MLVSRRAYDLILAERDYLRAELTKALDHNRRLERTQAGLGELQPYPRKLSPGVTREMTELINEFGSVEMRADLHRSAVKALKKGTSPEAVLEMLRESVDGEEE